MGTKQNKSIRKDSHPSPHHHTVTTTSNAEYDDRFPEANKPGCKNMAIFIFTTLGSLAGLLALTIFFVFF